MFKLYNHGGCLNHGCEAIVRSTKKILKRDVELWSMNPELDTVYGLDKIIDIKFDEDIAPGKLRSIYMKINAKLKKNDKLFYQQSKKKFYDNLKSCDVCLSVGGDLFCYSGVDKLYYIDQKIKKKKAKLVLWGCSVEPEEIRKNEIIRKALAQFDIITAREKFSYNEIKKYNPNTYLIPDPAFQLDAIKPEVVNKNFSGNTVGINLSPLILQYVSNNRTIEKSYEKLVDYILNKTDMKVALIPHVVYDFSDDRKPLKKLYEKFKASGRIVMIDDCNCSELKWYISKCRFVITARTHVSIASYSTCVPTLVIGYSVKSKGIANDIFGTYENYVVPVQDMETDTALVENFKWLMNNENKIKSHLENYMPEYCQRALDAGDKVRNLLIKGDL